MGEFRCVQCDYSLRGLAGQGRTELACPECGATTDLTALAIDIVRKRRARRSFNADITIMLGLTFLVILLSAMVDGLFDVSAFQRRLEFLLSSTGVAAIAVAFCLLSMLSFGVWPELPGAPRLLYAAGATLILLALPFPWSPLVFGAWAVGYQVRVMR